jgi:rfaE bifunctional protein nucleotidyltransferase chain/domain
MGQIVLDHEDLAKRVKGLRLGGKRVVVTNGCFDLLHVGHIRCLADAASRGDCLVVAINSDSSVRKLKGAGRPVQPQAERAEILCAIQGVSYVTIFDEESVGPLLKLLRPQIVAKGTDYTAHNLPEKDVVAEIGAELVIVGDPKRHSTIDLIARVRRVTVAAKPPKSSRAPIAKPAKAPSTSKPKAAAKGVRGRRPHARSRAVAAAT